jgi:hypothetical protein
MENLFLLRQQQQEARRGSGERVIKDQVLEKGRIFA